MLCAGWKNKFNLEDSLFAGALSSMVLENPEYDTICYSVNGAMDLYNHARLDLMGYIQKVAQRHRLKKNGLDDVIEYCHEFDRTRIIPRFGNGVITPVRI